MGLSGGLRMAPGSFWERRSLLWESGAKLGRYYANLLSPRQKGLLGEGLSWVKTRLSGDYPAGLQVRIPLSRSYTVADQVTQNGKVVEAKFGPRASLTAQQRLAEAELAAIYRVDRRPARRAGGGWLAALFGRGRQAGP